MKFTMWIKWFCCNWYSQTGSSGIWDQEAADHVDYCWWPCICGLPHWGTPDSWAMQWVHPKLWHCCIQQNLRFLLLVLSLAIFKRLISLLFADTNPPQKKIQVPLSFHVWSVSMVVLLQELYVKQQRYRYVILVKHLALFCGTSVNEYASI